MANEKGEAEAATYLFKDENALVLRCFFVKERRSRANCPRGEMNMCVP